MQTRVENTTPAKDASRHIDTDSGLSHKQMMQTGLSS
jgi:hypothetical protein